MPVTQLNHVTVRTDDIDGTRDFYIKVLGLPPGPRPPLGFPGYWMYCGDQPVVHIVPHSNGIGGSDADNTGCLDHVAFTAQDFDGLREHLTQLGIAYHQNIFPDIGLSQIFLRDPNEVVIELNFRHGE